MMTADQFAKVLYRTCLDNGLYQPEHLARVEGHCTDNIDEDVTPDYYAEAAAELERIVDNGTFYDIATGDFYDRPASLDAHLNAALLAVDLKFGRKVISPIEARNMQLAAYAHSRNSISKGE